MPAASVGEVSNAIKSPRDEVCVRIGSLFIGPKRAAARLTAATTFRLRQMPPPEMMFPRALKRRLTT